MFDKFIKNRAEDYGVEVKAVKFLMHIRDYAPGAIFGKTAQYIAASTVAGDSTNNVYIWVISSTKNGADVKLDVKTYCRNDKEILNAVTNRVKVRL